MAGAWLVLHALIGLAVPIADAGAEHAPVAAHWEDATERDCPADHGVVDCQLCQVLSGARSLPSAPALPPAAWRAEPRLPAPAALAAPLAAERGRPSGRSPPAV